MDKAERYGREKKRRKEAFGSVFKLNGGHVVMLAQAKGDREIKFSSAAYSLYTLDKYNIVKCPIALSAIEIEPRFKTGK